MKKTRIRRSHKKRVFPTPAFLPGIRGSAAWHVRPTEKGEIPHTVNITGGKAEMALPIGDSLTHKYTRLHELLHAAHSPVEQPRPLLLKDGSFISSQSLLMAEEFRINMISRAYLGGGAYLPRENDDWYIQRALELAKAYVNSGSGSAAMEFIHWILIVWPLQKKIMTAQPTIPYSIGGEDVGDSKKYGLLIQLAGEVCYTIWAVLWKTEITELMNNNTIPDWDSVLKLAAFLQDAEDTLISKSNPPADNGEEEGEKAPDAPDIAEARRRAREHLGTATKGDDDLTKLRGIRQKLTHPNFKDSSAVEWGKMVMKKAEMTFHLPKNKLQRSKYRATDEGSNPRYTHRLLTDGKVFSRKRKVPGGSVLIDDSGSMSWTTEELKEIILAAPATIIAAYSGHGDTGDLMIIAENARYADMETRGNHPLGGGNVIDLPALEWLAAQPKPRIWVSDTYVVPFRGDARESFEQCISLVEDYDINICFTVEEAGRVFQGKQEIYR